MNRTKIYWLCQIIGWVGYTFSDFGLYVLRYGYTHELIINALVTILLGIGITHTYRLIIKRLHWLELPLEKIIPRTLLAVVVMASVMFVLSFPLDYLTIPLFRQKINETGVIPLSKLAWGYLNWSKNLLLWSVIYHVYQYFALSKRNEIERMQLKSSLKDFEAKILRAQLNPHFMFNSLNSIRALILEDPSKAQASLTQLSNLLRNSLLSDRKKTVSLLEELKTVQDYLSLEKIRYEERLEIQTHINPDTLGIQVPPMMVQTLVENAVKHGISKPLKGGFISIDAHLERNFLNLIIRNTGILEKEIRTEGVGLLNTTQRLSLIYGQDASFQIHQETAEVVRAQLRLPI